MQKVAMEMLLLGSEKPHDRYAFSLCVARELGTRREEFDLLGTLELKTWPVKLDVLKARVRPWGLATLRAAALPFGRYSAELVTLDEDDEPDRSFCVEKIAWSGEQELRPAAQDQEAGGGHR